MKIKRKITVNIELTPEDIADCFCELYADEQAVFFNRISALVERWDNSFFTQLQSINSCEELTNDGREIMNAIGEYSEVVK